MGAKRVALSVAGTAALVYVVLSGRLSDGAAEEARRRRREEEEETGMRWPERAPASWREAAAVAARTVGFAYGETLGKWPLGDIAFGINHYMRVKGNLQHEYTDSNGVLLEGPGVRQELIELLRYLRLCMFFSRKPYEVFLEFGGYDQSDILIRKSKARLMKPAFTVVSDESTRCFLILIRGAISVKDRVTAATAAEVPFHHAVSQEGRRSSVVAGHAHCGMVAAARWIADQAIPCLSKAIEQFPDYRVKIIGHSMGAGIAAILTYILREDKKLSSSSCIAFGPAACMTWDLAESGKDFVTTVVNRNDLVPCFGKVSAATLRTEVMASSWAPDLQKQIQQKRIFGFLNSLSFMRSHIPSVSNSSSEEQASYSPEETGKGVDTGTDEEHVEQLLEALRSSQEPRHRQLYPPGRIMHMVALPAPDEGNAMDQGRQHERVSLYDTPRGMYSKIRLARFMIRDHYMPRYVESMEMLIDRLADSGEAITVTTVTKPVQT